MVMRRPSVGTFYGCANLRKRYNPPHARLLQNQTATRLACLSGNPAERARAVDLSCDFTGQTFLDHGRFRVEHGNLLDGRRPSDDGIGRSAAGTGRLVRQPARARIQPLPVLRFPWGRLCASIFCNAGSLHERRLGHTARPFLSCATSVVHMGSGAPPSPSHDSLNVFEHGRAAASAARSPVLFRPRSTSCHPASNFRSI